MPRFVLMTRLAPESLHDAGTVPDAGTDGATDGRCHVHTSILVSSSG